MNNAFISGLCNRVFKRLQNIRMPNQPAVEKIMWPFNYDDQGVARNSPRISEQEARFVFASEVENNIRNSHYTVEEPTQRRFKFGRTINDLAVDDGRSASHDLALYANNRKLYVEFKALNPKVFCYAKDLLKLFYSNDNGLFFHILKTADKGTVKSVGGKYNDSLNKVRKILGKGELVTGYVWIYVCNLNKEDAGALYSFDRNNKESWIIDTDDQKLLSLI